MADEPELAPWDGPLGGPPFDRIEAGQFLPAFAAATAAHLAELAAIRDDPAPADFDNVIAALERAGAVLSRVSRLFWTLSSAQADAGIRAIESEVSAVLSRHGSATAHDARLFERVAAVKASAAPLTPEQRRLVDKIHDGFVAGGAGLDAAAKGRFAAIDERLAALSAQFGQNVLAATNGWLMTLAEADLDGLPPSVGESAARRGNSSEYRIGLDRGTVETFLTFSSRRDLRERLWRAFVGRCDGGDFDNGPLIAEIVALRHERAALLGYPSYAAYKLEDSMAGSPDAAEALLLRLWEPAKRVAAAEAAELQGLIDAEGAGHRLEPWDWRFHAEKVRQARFALDGAAVKGHLRLDAVRAAAFETAERLYGLRFTRRKDVPVYHPDVAAWEVSENGAPAGLLYTDYLARPEKHGGAWMGSLQVQEAMDGAVLPIVYTVANIAPAADPGDSRLSLDEARTLFHEFGHALHALLSRVTYPSLAGTAVARDFVEFPSKLMEHWIVDAAVLARLGLPPALIEAIGKAETFGQGFATVELTASSLIDLALHSGPPPVDVRAFEAESLAALGMPDAIVMRHQLPVFTHIFDGGYAGAYYSYLWSELLDADVFAAFVEAGDLFDPAVARRLRIEVLGQGDARDPAASFAAFRGRAPDERYLLKSRGLLTS